MILCKRQSTGHANGVGMGLVRRWRDRTPSMSARRFVKKFGANVAPTLLLDGFQLYYVGNDTFALHLTMFRRSVVRQYRVKDDCPHCVMLRCFEGAARAFAWTDDRLCMIKADYEFKLGLGIQLGLGSVRPEEWDESHSANAWPCMVLARELPEQRHTKNVCTLHRG